VNETAVNLALLAARLGLAWILYTHATQKSLGWFSGNGLAGSTAVFERLGHVPGRQMTHVAVACELATAALLTLGLLTPLGALIGISTMLVAGSALTAKSRTYWNVAGGGEFPYALAGGVAIIALGGPGEWSIDHSLFDPWPVWLGPAVVVVAALAAIPPIARSSRRLAAQRAESSPQPSGRS
jgi:putative oxidoreductase